MAFDYTNYYELNYIESSGTQYINTGVTASSNINFDVYANIVNGNGWLLGTQYSGNTYYVTGSTVTFSRYNNITNISNTSNQWFNYVLNGNAFSFNNNTYNVSHTSTVDPSFPILLFACNYSVVQFDSNPIRIKYAKFYDGSNLIHNFVSAERKTDNAIGMYDVVTGTFYNNSGTGTFISGGKQENCRIKVNGSWVDGMMYFKVNGQWVEGKPYIKVNGQWKEGI